MFRWQKLNIITNMIPNLCTLISNVKDSMVCSDVRAFISKNCTSIFDGLVFLSQPVDFYLDLVLRPQYLATVNCFGSCDPGQKGWPSANPGNSDNLGA